MPDQRVGGNPPRRLAECRNRRAEIAARLQHAPQRHQAGRTGRIEPQGFAQTGLGLVQAPEPRQRLRQGAMRARIFGIAQARHMQGGARFLEMTLIEQRQAERDRVVRDRGRHRHRLSDQPDRHVRPSRRMRQTTEPVQAFGMRRDVRQRGPVEAFRLRRMTLAMVSCRLRRQPVGLSRAHACPLPAVRQACYG